MRHIDLFTGIGGFSLAASWVWDDHMPLAFVEQGAYCQRVLHKHWPDVPITDDIHDFDGAHYDAVDLITGGFPCQPFSSAGKWTGAEDDRYLWPEMYRVIREARPRYVVAENVRHLVAWNDGMVFDRVLSDLEAAGFEVVPVVLPAAGCGAHHLRERVWFVAHANGQRQQQPEGVRKQRRRWTSERRPALAVGNADSAPSHAHAPQRPSWQAINQPGRWRPEPAVGRVANGVSNRMDRLRALGNAIVPQVAMQIFRAIKRTEEADPNA